MKLKVLSLIAGAIALTLTATSFVVQAQTASSSPLLVAQTAKKQRGPWKNLDLTDAQKAQIQQIRRNTRAQIEAVFTPEQKEKLKAAFEARRAQRQAGQRPTGQRQGPWKNFAELNLTQAQKDQIRQIRESSRQQIQAVLTPEQQAKLKQFQENARQRHQQRQQNQQSN
ncbi:P pilus assembly/Cpx signaling pathway, periplasmic inhibitor/zinc-resistance associated protein [Nostoc sp. CENA67]|uniref:P pilus assembly/Cpx signaling pathway, periplasmic inhibitor/zinc-resistance associated protein n=1 Tax=Amazonocrinis nigriterrae CENA67 TaxID=2794033 RepID=A0A8J7HRV2_9NOST|nr:P pilus assembly/Cpx signaling pathway, periplasmic inhibitor/zinc-resistance associated protein [Amazonocrinis nigriterrae]MBH8562352.1 P pilus assembly/Cpx signaling pathway, periplasmic inhibitor/zinc-resistance associated protein [Amazonocrinis nigriterrae CENA67]